MSQCRYCKGTGKIPLLTTIVDCDCTTAVSGAVSHPYEFPRDSKLKNAWFSKKAALQRGSNVYLNERDQEVEITEIGSQTTPCGKWEDLQFVGIINWRKWVRGDIKY